MGALNEANAAFIALHNVRSDVVIIFRSVYFDVPTFFCLKVSVLGLECH